MAVSVGAANIVAGGLGDTAPAYLAEVSDAFMSGFGVARLVAAFVAGAGAVFAAKFLPAQAADIDAEAADLFGSQEASVGSSEPELVGAHPLEPERFAPSI